MKDASRLRIPADKKVRSVSPKIAFGNFFYPQNVIWHFALSPMEKEIKNKILVEILSQPSL
jgi:hypothetical protein